MNAHYLAVAERAGHRCEYCLAPEAIFNFPFEVEHIVPPRHGGADDLMNLALFRAFYRKPRGTIRLPPVAPGLPTWLARCHLACRPGYNDDHEEEEPTTLCCPFGSP